MKPDRHPLINVHDRIVTRDVLGDLTEIQAANQNNENTNGQMQAGVALWRKPVL
jgi:hypothetical protein